MNIPGATNSQGEAPEVEDGLYVAKFVGVESRHVPSFVTDKDKFGHPDDGNRIDFNFALLDEDGNPVLKGDGDDPDDILILRQAKSIKVLSSGEKSNSYAMLKGILTPAELALFIETGKGDEAADAAWAAAAEKVDGRIVNVQVTHSSTGWPQIEAALGPVKTKAKAAKAAAKTDEAE